MVDGPCLKVTVDVDCCEAAGGGEVAASSVSSRSTAGGSGKGKKKGKEEEERQVLVNDNDAMLVGRRDRFDPEMGLARSSQLVTSWPPAPSTPAPPHRTERGGRAD